MSGSVLPLGPPTPYDPWKPAIEQGQANELQARNVGQQIQNELANLNLQYKSAFQKPVFSALGSPAPATPDLIGRPPNGGLIGSLTDAVNGPPQVSGNALAQASGAHTTGPAGMVIPGFNIAAPTGIAMSIGADPEKSLERVAAYQSYQRQQVATALNLADSPAAWNSAVGGLWHNGFIATDVARQLAGRFADKDTLTKALAPVETQVGSTAGLAQGNLAYGPGGITAQGQQGAGAQARGQTSATAAKGAAQAGLTEVTFTDSSGLPQKRLIPTSQVLQAGEANPLGPPVAAPEIPAAARGFLRALSPSEASAPNVRNSAGGTRPATFDPSQGHPGAGAAGLFQDMPETWQKAAAGANVDPNDMSQANQERANWWLAQRTYGDSTGRDLLHDLQQGGHEAQITNALKSTWPSITGGSQENSVGKTFQQRLPVAVQQHVAAGDGLPGVAAEPPVGAAANIENNQAAYRAEQQAVSKLPLQNTQLTEAMDAIRRLQNTDLTTGPGHELMNKARQIYSGIANAPEMAQNIIDAKTAEKYLAQAIAQQAPQSDARQSLLEKSTPSTDMPPGASIPIVTQIIAGNRARQATVDTATAPGNNFLAHQTQQSALLNSKEGLAALSYDLMDPTQRATLKGQLAGGALDPKKFEQALRIAHQQGLVK